MFSHSELDSLFRYSLSLCHDNDEAYDLLYNNIEKLIGSNSELLQINSKMAFMKRCIRNSYLDVRRHEKIRLIKSDILKLGYEEMQREIDSLEDTIIREQEVEHLLGDLQSDERELLYLWAVEDFTAQEIAEIQGGARGTWLSRIHRIKKKLRAKTQTETSPKQGDQI
ncbi:MAG TPA: RNA polymerase sigma factor [Pseudomonadales bacterium]|jgi:RNA polymerase sigma-70 factor (ECF subfamily)|nr:RNA polymerase subunit sigma-24 [Gammaproteobacteria bacterium]MDP6027907.1 RNA polymerase sigma factor [Pseudomonadales bacterium]MDP6316134.1 RNA polymerase sigma factor [Pseudomonadales bacterium]MDP7315604.1 RNA polymerase sigma factor [Pseudomonadales bacterium]MDP7576999.1 RNA polymerase sigma factor [Pseudomonadales bacterium]|tara:strand:+ start:1011 stop:1514 length:504 start_codon:yes stop_codon:yes gene_type:complete